jgi:cell division control protein 24
MNGGPKSSNTNKTNSIRQEKPFVSLYERTMTLIGKLYSLPDYEYYLFPDGVDALLSGDSPPVIDPIAILWHCFRLGAPLCHLLNQLRPRNLIAVPDVSGLTNYTNVCKKCIYHFLIGVKEELGVTEEQLFAISELYKDDTNGLVKVINTVNMVFDEMQRRNIMPPEKKLPFATNLTAVETGDNRSKAVSELLITERKYIESLQELMIYQEDITKANVISKDLIHMIFANLNELLDFQRRFLFSLEATLALPPEEQHIGAIFIQYVLLTNVGRRVFCL